MNIIKKNSNILYTFSISFLIMTIAFAGLNLYPFGKQQIMVIDSWHQYYPFLQELHYKLTHGESLFYSFKAGLGSNFWAIMAYYAMSPLYLLSVLFKAEYLREFMMFITMVKISLAATFFAIYLRSTFKKNDASIIFFGMLYGFCGFAMGYYWNIMWLDCVALLPLIILGLNKLLDENRFVLYTVSLAIALISNFYIGYFLCEFLLLYFFVLYFGKISKFNFKHFIQKILQMGLFSGLAVGIAAIVLIPTYKALQLSHNYGAKNDVGFESYYSLIDIFNNLLSSVPVSVKSGLPNIYSGLICVLLVIVYFFIRSIPVKAKVLNFVFLLFLVFSFNIKYLNFAMHGFKFPNEVPYRFAFVFSFLMLIWAYEAFTKLHEIKEDVVWKIGGIFFVYLLICQKMYTELFDDHVFYVSILFLILYTVCLHYYMTKGKANDLALGFLLFVILGEVVMSAVVGVQVVGSSGRDTYPSLNAPVQKELTKLDNTDNSFYRMEMTRWYSTNDPTLYGYYGASTFSSMLNSNVTKFTKNIGLAASSESNRYLYTSSTPVVNSMLSIKYLMAKEGKVATPNVSLDLMSETKDVALYKNKYYLPIGFMVNPAIENWNFSSEDPFLNQQRFMELATSLDKKIFHEVLVNNVELDNVKHGAYQGIRYGYKNINTSEVGKMKFEFIAPETKQMYVYLYTNNSYNAKIKVNDKEVDYETRRGIIADLGIVEKGTKIYISTEVFAASGGYVAYKMVTFDEEAYNEVFPEMADETLQVNEYDSTYIQGTIDVLNDGTLYTSIPYEKGWTATVDGDKVEILPLQNAFITLPLTTGTHQIEFRYVPDGFKAGALVSGGTVLILILITVVVRRMKKKKMNVATMDAVNALVGETIDFPDAEHEEETVDTNEEDQEVEAFDAADNDQVVDSVDTAPDVQKEAAIDTSKDSREEGPVDIVKDAKKEESTMKL